MGQVPCEDFQISHGVVISKFLFHFARPPIPYTLPIPRTSIPRCLIYQCSRRLTFNVNARIKSHIWIIVAAT